MDMMDTKISEAAHSEIRKMQKSPSAWQFLTKLRLEFEHARASLLNRGTDLNLDAIVKNKDMS